MRRRLVALVFLLLVALPASAATAAQPAAGTALDRLRRDVVAQLARSGATVRAAAVALEGAGTVVDLQATALLPPASTQKLFTVGAALLRLGPGTRLRTEVRVTREPLEAASQPLVPLLSALAPVPPTGDPSTVLDLALVAGGDPSLSGADLDRLAAEVAGSGVRQVTGRLWVDDTRLDRARTPGGWKPSFVPGESGPLSALSVDVNGWRRDAAFLADPATANGERFRQALSRSGVGVADPTTLGPLPGGPGQVVAARESAPVAELGAHVLRSSDNFQAEMLLKALGAPSGQGSTGGGLAVLDALQDDLGVPRGRAGDGSGLSAHDRQSAAGEVAWLRALDASEVGGAFRAALPVYCRDGTLRQRLCGTAGAGRVLAKTGTLPGVVTLAGTTTTASGRRAWFAFLLAGVGSASRARAAVDQAALVLATSGA